MRILAIDVGAGTQDILLFDERRNEENNAKLVLPSQTKIIAKRISRVKKPLLVTGETMGGSAISWALIEHVKKGFEVALTEEAARTIRDDLGQVRELGMKIISEEEAENEKYKAYEKIGISDVDFEFIFGVLKNIGEEKFDFLGIAVQDHGHEKGKSDRITRFEKIRETLEGENGSSLLNFLYESPPEYYTRMNSVLKGLKRKMREHKADKKRIFLIDTKIAAIAGAAHGVEERPLMVIDAGNGHTMCAVVEKDYEVASIFEHHTMLLKRKALESYAVRLADGELTNEEIYGSDGHGCYVKKRVGFEKIKKIIATGPRRGNLKNSRLDITFANPYGDVMLTGSVGIVDLILRKVKKKGRRA